MKFVVVIDADEKVQKELTAALREVDPTLIPKCGKTLDDLKNIVRIVVEDKKSKEAALQGKEDKNITAENDMVVAVLMSYEVFGYKSVELAAATLELLKREGLSNSELPTAFLVTAFEGTSFSIKPFFAPAISNLIFKPVDKSLFMQLFSIALAGRTKFKSEFLYSQQTDIQIEMIKDVALEEISDFGFSSRSNQSIATGAIARYQHPLFMTSDSPSGVYARCVKCEPHPSIKGEFRCEMTFFGNSTSQTNNVRKFLKNLPKSGQRKLFGNSPQVLPKDPKSRVVVIDPGSVASQQIQEVVQRNFSNSEVVMFKSYIDFLAEVDPKYSGEKKNPLVTDLSLSAVYDFSKKILSQDPGNASPTPISFLGFEQNIWTGAPDFLLNQVHEADRELFEKFVVDLAGPVKKFIVRLRDVSQGIHVVRVDKIGAGLSPGQIKFSFVEMAGEEKNAFLAQFKKIRGKVDAIVASDKTLIDQAEIKISNMKESLAQSGFMKPDAFKFFVYSEGEVALDTKWINLGVTDVFLAPLDKVTLQQKLALYVSPLTSDTVKGGMTFFATQQTIKAVKDVQIIQVSESGVVAKYSKAIPFAEVRSFYLKSATVKQSPEIFAKCTFSEELEEEGMFLNYFVFFAMTDGLLKHVRTWNRDYYVSKKNIDQAS